MERTDDDGMDVPSINICSDAGLQRKGQDDKQLILLI
jgi:hypothetical protein